ncbi:hypothetical protein [Nonlabens antarcticus]|uniref:hypothetical protein n=1 Tax=Nonlabens antarcticus TaxID=392714 RepID=UPI0018915871|nr:hypothetical protein [Nonlabens antarcticus]
MKQLLYHLSKAFSWIFLVLFAFLFVFSTLGFAEYYFGWDVPFVALRDEGSAIGSFLFVTIPIINISLGFPPNWFVIIPLIIFSFYSLYFFKLSRFFKVFITKTLFSAESILSLKKFLWLNLIIVGVATIAYAVLLLREGFRMDESALIMVIHTIASLLVYLYLDMAQKGYSLKQENDLTI